MYSRMGQNIISIECLELRTPQGLAYANCVKSSDVVRHSHHFSTLGVLIRRLRVCVEASVQFGILVHCSDI